MMMTASTLCKSWCFNFRDEETDSNDRGFFLSHSINIESASVFQRLDFFDKHVTDCAVLRAGLAVTVLVGSLGMPFWPAEVEDVLSPAVPTRFGFRPSSPGAWILVPSLCPGLGSQVSLLGHGTSGNPMTWPCCDWVGLLLRSDPVAHAHRTPAEQHTVCPACPEVGPVWACCCRTVSELRKQSFRLTRPPPPVTSAL